MATCVAPSSINPKLFNDSLRKGRASVTGVPTVRPGRPSFTNIRPGRNSVPTKYVPRTPSSSSGESSDSSKSSDSDSSTSASTVSTNYSSSPSTSSFSSSPKKKNFLSMFQPSPSLSHRSSFKLLSQPKEPSLESAYGKCTTSLGSGSHANVMLCDSRIHGRMYAVKRFRKMKVNESEREYTKRLFGEYCISSTMRHDNVVETLDLIRNEDGRLCLVMELCAGGDLFSYIKATMDRSPNYPEVHCYLKQLINGIAYLHSNGVAHRDIKPENLLLSGDGTILKISDFGVAEVFKTMADARPHKCIGLCGSEPYIAPEQFEGKAEYDAAKVDIWSVGIVFYALLTGSMPWRRATRGDVDYDRYLELNQSRTLSEGFRGFDRVEGPARDIIYTILQTDAALRPTAKELKKNKWIASIPTCHIDDPSPHHTHYAIAHHSSDRS